MNPCASPNISSTHSSLKNLIALSNHILQITPNPPTLNANLIQCPFNPHHLLPPHSLFLHHLRCPSSPRPLPHLFSSNFFYRHSPAVVAFSPAPSTTPIPTLTLPSFLYRQCADTHNSNPERASHHAPILPSHYWAITREIESWNHYPSTYSNAVLRAISALEIANLRHLTNWIIANSPRYGVVIDTPTQEHIFLLCCLCLKSILREASASLDQQKSLFECPVLNQALTWLASQVSILYGETNGKVFVLDLLKKCISVGASVLLLFPIGDEASVSKQESQNDNGDAQREENTNYIQNRKIFVSQVEEAVEALHERSLLEHQIKGFWFSQRPSNYQLVAEHCYLSEQANEERKKRHDYRPLIDHDGLYRQQSANQETSREKTREELLAEERDYKRRRMSYRGKKTNQSPLQVMRYMIEEYMEEIKQSGGVGSPVKVSEESGLFPSKPAGHDLPTEANNSRRVSHDSPAMIISNPTCEKQSRTNFCDKSKAVEDTFSRDYKQHKQGDHPSHYYREDQEDADQGKYYRDRTSTSPERRRSHSRPHDRSIPYKKQDYSNRKKYYSSSRTRDKRPKDTHRSHISDSFLSNAFPDRYDPSESLDICEEDISSDANHIKSGKIYDKKPR
ncbi:U11/U12 small nuclear ribonucleoprotein 48 kDa protein [Abrus precatorius]|uniref:U11/U12 small nuclear ribonucleoprotein 48 kDa protein n=1 Tax=Abrus precatorius TaxID=3816 RepID=A0A8B8M883_ABRPR|nr:U11/U12 small nuclear ribonucleoprotein 48 kDa protein [Abrus precatorius]XP_027364240.1 U11/U12 small nuclear ribonucleoprotein 48 kDa protein [Abrus precatorius]